AERWAWAQWLAWALVLFALVAALHPSSLPGVPDTLPWRPVLPAPAASPAPAAAPASAVPFVGTLFPAPPAPAPTPPVNAAAPAPVAVTVAPLSVPTAPPVSVDARVGVPLVDVTLQTSLGLG